MHEHHWYEWLHIPMAALLGTLPWWIEKIDAGGHVLTVLAPYVAATVGGLQIAYLVRKHRRLK